MPDVTLVDVLTGAKATWSADAILSSIVPDERVYAFGVPESTDLPYCTIDPGDVSAYFGGTTYFSGSSYIKVNSVNFTVYGLYGTVNWTVLSQQLSDVFGWTSTNPRGSWQIPNAISVVSAMPEVDEFKRTGERVNGLEVLSYASKFSVTIQANRG